MRTTAILTDQSFDAHTWYNHVEQAARLQAIRDAIEAADLRSQVQSLTPSPAPEAALLAVHSPQLLRRLRQTVSYGGGHLDPDTYVTANSWDAAVLAAGCAIGAVEAVLRGQVQNAFALVRPPGHHATPDQAMGFCLLNNIAIAARYALDHLGIQRVAIVDFDVHHGNGTQDIFYSEPRVLFCSTHASPFYPGTGSIDEMGDPTAAPGATLNVPLPFGVGDQGYPLVFERVLVPALRRFRPELILVSAGYDAHWSDPLGPMMLSVQGYNRLTRTLIDLADELCAGKIVMVLEGGYNLRALSACVVAALRLLLGQDSGPDPIGQVDATEPLAQVNRVIETLRARHPLLHV